MYPDCEAEGICEEDGSVHRVHGAVPDVKQCGCVVKAQVAATRGNTHTAVKLQMNSYSNIFISLFVHPQKNLPI